MAITFTPTTTPAAGQSGMDMAMALMAPQQGSAPDPRDAPGSGVSIMRELMQGLSTYGIGALAGNNAGNVFSPANRALLAPEYQRQKGK